jgi:hypothetical protein
MPSWEGKHTLIIASSRNSLEEFWAVAVLGEGLDAMI